MILNLTQTQDCCNDLITDYSIFLQSLLLIISNFFLLPAIYIALKCRYFGETIVYILTMLASTFYHMCDNGRLKFCLFSYDVLQFCDFYSAILTLWVTTILMSDIPYEWRSVFHLSGSLFFAGLLRSKTTGVWSFVIPGICAVLLLSVTWSYQCYYKKVIPTSLKLSRLIPGVILSSIGAILFASQVTRFGEFYGFTHSGWHICMSLAVSFLLPKNLLNRISFGDYSDRICVLSSNA